MTADHGDHGHDDHGPDADRPAYDPRDKTLPERAPPLRRTAPQSEYTLRDVGVGFLVLLVGVGLAVGLPLVLV